MKTDIQTQNQSENQRLKELETELLEQCRLLGKSGEREAKHLSIIENLRRDNLRLSAKIQSLEKN